MRELNELLGDQAEVLDEFELRVACGLRAVNALDD